MELNGAQKYAAMRGAIQVKCKSNLVDEQVKSGGRTKEAKVRDLLFSSTNMAAMTSRAKPPIVLC